MAVKPIPEGYHSITPYLVAKDAEELIAFIKKAFDAQERFVMKGPNGTIAHAEFQIGDSIIMLAQSGAEHKANVATICLYVPDVDATYNRALKAGGTSIGKPVNKFYGDRMAGVEDPSGNRWFVGTHIEDVSPQEMAKRAREQHPAGAHA